ncbi:MAG TPA: beta-ketoacyl-ACP synthase II [candidate division Zixibacteria bacterium]|nr:beta-ketoacyl-ACP synthase II [candidate division Zixibacteria bacterium]
MDRIVITGLGAITPIGNDVETFWKNIVAGVSGASDFDHDEFPDYPVHVQCDVKDFDPTEYMSSKQARLSSRSTQFSIAAARQAVSDANVEFTAGDNGYAAERIGVVMNTGGGGISEAEDGTRTFLARGPRAVSPFMIPKGMPNAVSAGIAMDLGVKGLAITTTIACASGNYALVEGYHFLMRREVDLIIAGGAESVISPVYMAGLHRMQALSRWDGEPSGASRPFDADRSGFVFGEGAGALILEREESAVQRGAHIYAEVVGGRLTADAFHITAPDPEGYGAARAMAGTLESAGVSAEDIDVIYAHGTATPLGDVAETKAIKLVFGDRASKLLITATKSTIGHTMGAAGAISSIAAVCGIQDSLVPPTINLVTPDPDCDLDYVPLKARTHPHQMAMVNAFGFGGHNACVVIGKYHG